MYFTDRSDAGRELAKKLMKYAGKEIIVYAIPRGGVVTAYEIAKKLYAPLDLIITRKIGHPYEAEYAIAALSENGTIVGNQLELQKMNHDWLEHEIHIQRAEIQRRRKLYLQNRRPLPVEGKIAILVDDGIATGLTMEAAVKDIRNRHPKRIVIATPVAFADSLSMLRKSADDVIALAVPSHFPGGIGAYYINFPQVSDREVMSFISKAERHSIRNIKEIDTAQGDFHSVFKGKLCL